MSSPSSTVPEVNRIASLSLDLRYDTWLSAMTSWHCWNATPRAGDGSGYAIRPEAPTLVTVHVADHDAAALKTLLLAGFDLVDTTVLLRRRPSAVLEGSARQASITSLTIAPARPEHAEQIGSIAERTLTLSRFHEDPRIDNGLAREIKRQWARNLALGQRGVTCLTASIDGTLIGFLGIAANSNPLKGATLDLMAVIPEWQGRGVGSALIKAFVAYCDARMIPGTVGTQLRNVKALRAYQAGGFRIEASQFVLHGHFPNGLPQ